jgi:hypothetical protein
MSSHRVPGSSLLVALATLLLGAALPAQAAGPLCRQAPPTLLAGFDVSAGTVQALHLAPGPTGAFVVPIRLGADVRTLCLSPHDVRAPGFRLLVQDAHGVHPEPTPPCVTYRGFLREEPGAAVVASIIGGGLDAIVYRQQPPGAKPESWIVQPVRTVDPRVGASLHVVYRADDSVLLPYRCGVVTPPGQPTAPVAGIDITRDCQIALEADVQFYQLNGSSVTATQNDIVAVMNQVDYIYDRDCDVQFTVTTILVTTSTVYTTNDASTLLYQFQTRWNAVYGSVQRDVAHLFTGRSLLGATIGISYLSTICSSSSGYGLSQSRFSTNFSRRVGLTSHEIGHNFSATHCDSISPCYIMCATLGGCSGNVTLFSPFAIGEITGFAATRSCLAVVQSAPALSSATPSTVTVFQPGSVHLGGSGFTGVTSYRIGAQTYSTGFYVSSDTSMTVTMPPSTTVGWTSVSVTSPLGTSNALPIAYTVTAPPKLHQPTTIPSTGGVAQFDFAGAPGRLWFLVLSLGSTTSPFGGYPLLNNPIVLGSGVFGLPLGIEQLAIPVPGGLGLLLVYSELLEVNALLLAPSGVSTVAVTILL